LQTLRGSVLDQSGALIALAVANIFEQEFDLICTLNMLVHDFTIFRTYAY